MHSWRARFASSRQQLHDNADEDDFVLGLILGLQGREAGEEESVVASGSRPGKKLNLERDRAEMNERMMKDYFAENAVYGPNLFRHRYRMRCFLFMSIPEAICDYGYFLQWLMLASWLVFHLTKR